VVTRTAWTWSLKPVWRWTASTRSCSRARTCPSTATGWTRACPRSLSRCPRESRRTTRKFTEWGMTMTLNDVIGIDIGGEWLRETEIDRERQRERHRKRKRKRKRKEKERVSQRKEDRDSQWRVWDRKRERKRWTDRETDKQGDWKLTRRRLWLMKWTKIGPSSLMNWE